VPFTGACKRAPIRCVRERGRKGGKEGAGQGGGKEGAGQGGRKGRKKEMEGIPDLLKVVKVELTDQGLKAGVTEIFRKNLAFKACGVLDMEGEAV